MPIGKFPYIYNKQLIYYNMRKKCPLLYVYTK